MNNAVKAVYDEIFERLVSLEIGGNPVEMDHTYQIGLQSYHAMNSEKFLGFTMEELSELNPPRILATSMQSVIDEYLRAHQEINREVEGRLIYR